MRKVIINITVDTMRSILDPLSRGKPVELVLSAGGVAYTLNALPGAEEDILAGLAKLNGGPE